jgi:GMP synthase-like glutamine amidotransferase
MKFLVFQHIACEHPGIFRDLMAADGVEYDAVELDEGEKIPKTSGYDALLVMGGPMDVWQTDQHPWLLEEISVIRDWINQDRSYLGFCLGHQLLALAAGGEVGVAVQPEIGILPVSLTDAGKSHWFFKNCPESIASLQWHSAEVTKAPDDAVILADSPACQVNAMSVGDKAVSVQFHVEMTDTTVGEWGEVPEYALALEATSGQGAFAKMKTDVERNMPQFNALSESLYRNFVAMVRRQAKQI